jgi:cobalamin biosynthesis protein CobD/CbiB
MNLKTCNALLVLTSLFGYLEWGGGNKMFLFEGEWQIIQKLFSNPAEVMHPFVLIPLAGQLLLIATLFQSEPDKRLTWVGMAAIAVLLLFMFLIGVLSLNFKILFSTVPFLVLAMLTIRTLKSSQK